MLRHACKQKLYQSPTRHGNEKPVVYELSKYWASLRSFNGACACQLHLRDISLFGSTSVPPASYDTAVLASMRRP